MSSPSNARITTTNFLFVLIFLWTTQQVAVGFRNNWHSVLQCDTSSTLVSSFSTANDCRLHCEHTYVISSLESIRRNKNLYESILTKPSESDESQQVKCCCAFNTKLPDWMVNIKLINRKSNKNSGSSGFGVCYPIGVSFLLSARTVESYGKMCSLLKIELPLTILELRQFVKVAAYLNYMKPKHPSISTTLNKLKEVNKISSLNMIDEFEQVLYESLFDNLNRSTASTSEKHNNRLEQLEQSQRKLSELLKSPVVSRAFDELVINNVLNEIVATNANYKEANKSVLRLPEELLRGEFDKYDKTGRGHYFSVKQINCNELRLASNQLTKFLTYIKRLLAKLDEKLLFEHLSANFKQLSELIETAQVYKNLLEVNCAGNSRRD